MKRYFLLIIITYIGLATVYKSFVYINSDKVSGKVVGIERYANIYKTKNGTSTEVSKSPIVVYRYQNLDWEASQNKWGHINFLEIGDEVTVLIDRNDNNNLNINTFIQFWFTRFDMVLLLFLSIFGTAILESIFPSKEKASL